MEAIREPVSALTFCWTIERTDGAGVALTSHDAPIHLDGRKFSPCTGLQPSAVIKGGIEEALGECGGALTSDALTESDLLAGRWDRAQTSFVALDWSERTEPIELSAGEVGEVEVNGASFSAELLGAGTWMRGPVAPTTSPECRATLGDKKCRVDLAGRRRRVVVTGARAAELTVLSPVEERFILGSARWIRGANCGLRSVLVGTTGERITIRDVPFFPVAPGDMLLLTEGCDKRLQTCSERFENAVNFRGEPHLPGNDLLTRYPGN